MIETPPARPAGLHTRFATQRVAMGESGLFRWWWIVALGIASVLIGTGILVWPGAALQVMAALAGIWLVGAGLGRIVRRGRWRVLSGVVLVATGIVCLRDLGTAVMLIAVVVSGMWLLSGITGAVMAVNGSGGMSVLLAVAALVSVALGLVFLFVPRLSLYTLVVTTGVGFVLTGAIQVVVGIGLRRDDGS